MGGVPPMETQRHPEKTPLRVYFAAREVVPAACHEKRSYGTPCDTVLHLNPRCTVCQHQTHV